MLTKTTIKMLGWLFLAPIVGFCTFGMAASTSAISPHSGTSGSCIWTIDTEGNLLVRPTAGAECTLASMEDNNTSAPWYNYRLDITTVSFSGKVKTGESARGLFLELKNATSINLTNLDTSNTTNMQAMFWRCESVTELDFSGFDTSKVTNMSSMFNTDSRLNSLDLSSFDTSNVVDMQDMFYNSKLTSINLSSFNTSKVENFQGWLFGCDFASIDLSNIDTSSATNMVTMLGNAEYTIQQITIGENFNLKPKTSYGASIGRGMFQNVETGEVYPAVQISAGGMPGTYKKISDVSNEFKFDYSVDYRIDRPTSIKSFETTRNDIFTVTEEKVFAKVPIETVEEYDLPGEFTIVYGDIVSDVDGNKYDLKMHFSNIKFYDLARNNTISEAFAGITGFSSNDGIGLYGKFYYSIDGEEVSINRNNNSRSYDVDISIVDGDGNTLDGSYIFSIGDLDGSSYRDRDFGYPSVANPDRGYGYYSEGVYLNDGFEMGTLMKSEYANLLLLDNNTRITGLSNDNVSERTEFLIKANAAESSITYTTVGGMNSVVLDRYQPEVVEITNLDESDRKELAGARLELYSGDTLIESWESESVGKKLWLMPGMYTLKSITAPDDYEIVTEEVLFFVDLENGVVIDGEKADKVEALDRKPATNEDENTEPIEVPNTGYSSGTMDKTSMSNTGVVTILGIASVVVFLVVTMKHGVHKIDFKQK